MYEQDIDVPAVVHGPLIISLADLNGFEFGTKVRNPYQQLFERKPDEIIVNGYAVYYGDYSLPEAAALEFMQRSRRLLKSQPAASLLSARQAVALVPRGFDESLALGDSLRATGDQASAREAYAVALSRIPEMEPSARAHWMPVVAKKLHG